MFKQTKRKLIIFLMQEKIKKVAKNTKNYLRYQKKGIKISDKVIFEYNLGGTKYVIRR